MLGKRANPMPTPNFAAKDDSPYWLALGVWAKKYSDGCTCVKDIYVEACWEHDWHYRTGHTFPNPDGRAPELVTEAQANTRFRQVMQFESRLGRFSPISWWRYAGVSLFGRFFYHPDPSKYA